MTMTVWPLVSWASSWQPSPFKSWLDWVQQTAHHMDLVTVRAGPPEFVMSPSDLRVTSGTDVVLPCQPHRPTNENLSLTWLKDGRPLLEV